MMITAAWHQQALLAARANGEPFLERNVLAVLSELVLSGARIEPDFQALANAVVAKALITGKLPPKKSGTRAASRLDAASVALAYFEQLEERMPRGGIVHQLAVRFNSDERHIERLIAEGRKWVPGGHYSDDAQHDAGKAARHQARLNGVGYAPGPPPDSPAELAGLPRDEALQRIAAIIGNARGTRRPPK